MAKGKVFMVDKRERIARGIWKGPYHPEAKRPIEQVAKMAGVI